MFGRRKQPPIRSLIGEGTTIHGTIAFTEGLRVDGTVVGDLVAEGDGPTVLVLSEKSSVTGKVDAAHVIINGCVSGPVVSTQLLELQPKARITGEIRYEALEMHQGATVEGSMQRIGDAGEAPPLKLLTSSRPSAPG